jgi:hypothetical protein
MPRRCRSAAVRCFGSLSRTWLFMWWSRLGRQRARGHKHILKPFAQAIVLPLQILLRRSSHWHYRTDRAQQRKCWYLDAANRPFQQASVQVGRGSAPAKPLHPEPAESSYSVASFKYFIRHQKGADLSNEDAEKPLCRIPRGESPHQDLGQALSAFFEKRANSGNLHGLEFRARLDTNNRPIPCLHLISVLTVPVFQTLVTPRSGGPSQPR